MWSFINLAFSKAVYVLSDGGDGLEAAHQGRVPVRLGLRQPRQGQI